MKHARRFFIGTLVTVVLAVTLALLAAGGESARAQVDVIYVDSDATGGANDGSSWADAFLELQDALDAAGTGDQVWVAEGTYAPTRDFDPDDPRSSAFQMVNGVAIYGGFRGLEKKLEQRDWVNNLTILSGDLNGDDVPPFTNDGENSYHVFYNFSVTLDTSAILDGFVISGGNADGAYPYARGGGMYNSGGSPMIRNTIFLHNRAGEAGGGMYNEGSSPVLRSVTFTSNWAILGGGMYNAVSSPELTSCAFLGNVGKFYGGAMYNEESSLTLSGCTFANNSAADVGGGIYSYWSSLTLSGVSVFLNNSAYQGGAMYNEFSSPVLSGVCTFANNSAAYEGGGMYNDVASPELTGCIFSGNEAPSGGGMYNAWNSSPKLTDCTFSGNDATWGGGMYNASSSPELTGCTFSGNSGEWGGGMYNSDSSPKLTLCTFAGNSVISDGAGMCNVSSSPMLIGCTFSENDSSYSGGGMSNEDSYPTLINCIFEGNSSTDGGGMYNLRSAPQLTRCDFVNNSTPLAGTGHGGGMYNEESSPGLTDCTFVNNESIWGGGMANRYNSMPMLTSCIFSGNTAVHDGGGLHNISYSVPILANCTFSGNSAEEGGGIFGSFYSSAVLTNCTFWGNSATSVGGGIYNIWYTRPRVTNCILWGDTAGGAPSEIANDANSSANVTYSDVQGNYTGTGNIADDPLFVDAANGDFHLGTGSPCIDVGDNNAPYLPPEDFEGQLRILDGDDDGTEVVDMGVDEAPGPYTPSVMVVDIAVTPSTPSNIIRLSSPDPVPVAILSDEDLDAPVDVMADTVIFAGAPNVGLDTQDVDNDGDDDLILFFYPADMVDLNDTSTEATLTGETSTGMLIKGSDEVEIR